MSQSKGIFTLARQKIRGSQDNSRTIPEPSKPYAQYFSFNSNGESRGHALSYDDYFKNLRKTKLDQICALTKQIVLRAELLTNKNEHIPRNGNTKERLKYEQNIVKWMEDSVVSICTSCMKGFGIFGRKHHCRLDGRIICNQCSRFISFSLAQWLSELNASSSLVTDDSTHQRLMNLLNITSSVMINDGSNEDYLRICSSCAQILEKSYAKIRFKNIRKEEIFVHYDKILRTHTECHHIHPTYTLIIDSLLIGETTYQITDAQGLYQLLNLKYDQIDSTSRLIARLADSSNEPDKRYIVLCRNIRTYSIHILQNYSKLTRSVPTSDDIKQAQGQRISTLTIISTEKKQVQDENTNKLTIVSTEKKQLVAQQSYQSIRFSQKDKLSGNDDEIVFF